MEANISIFQTLDLSKVVEEYYEVSLQPNKPTMTQKKNQNEKKTKKGKGKVMRIYCCFLNYLLKSLP
ncbi:hypothetical protein CR513_14579, partial [Mucuna pruriens]